jgi:hypothetical protein
MFCGVASWADQRHLGRGHRGKWLSDMPTEKTDPAGGVAGQRPFPLGEGLLL